MKSRMTMPAVACAASMLMAVSAIATPQYTIVDLGPNTLGYGLNNLGQVVGTWISPDGLSHAYMWDQGEAKDIGTFRGGMTTATAINDAGQIVGNAKLADRTDQPFLYDQGVMTEIGVKGTAWNINNVGQVVGVGYADEGPPWMYSFVWQNGRVTHVAAPAGMETMVRGINDSGVVSGSMISATLTASQQPFYFDGTMHTLASPTLSSADAYAINNQGQMVGSGMIDGWSHAIMWDGGTVVDLGLLGSGTAATDVNDLKQVVGYIHGPTDGNYHAFLWDRGVLYDLNALIPSESGILITMATGINNRGQIVGYGTSLVDGLGHGFVLTPSPEPMTAILLMVAGVFCGRSRRY